MDWRGLDKSEHYNALGYVIAERGQGSARAMTVWGLEPNGTRIHIGQARSGAGDSLKCECGAGLIARKGPKNAHHFAHESGGAEECRKAQLAALCQLTVDVLKRFEKLHLPPVQGRPLTTGFDNVWEQTVGDFGGACLERGEGDNRRELVVICKTKRGQKVPSIEEFESDNRSAMLIDLSPIRNRPDDELLYALFQTAEREWLHNARHRDAASPGKASKVRISRNLRPADNSQSTKKDRTESEALSAPMKSKPPPSISKEEWETLHWSELQRRFFGKKRSW